MPAARGDRRRRRRRGAMLGVGEGIRSRLRLGCMAGALLGMRFAEGLALERLTAFRGGFAGLGCGAMEVVYS
jgi:hypothetical protein